MIWNDDIDQTIGALPPAKALPQTLSESLSPFSPPAIPSELQGVPLDQAEKNIMAPIHEVTAPGFVDRLTRGLGASIKAGYENAPIMGTDFTMAQHYAPLLEAVNRGRDPADILPNPYIQSELNGGGDATLPTPRGFVEDQIWHRLEDLRRTNPGMAGNLPKNRDDLLANVHAEQRTASDYADQLAATSGGPINRYLTPFAGQTIGQTADPENIMALAMGGPATTSLVRTFLQDGAINAGLTAITMPFEMQHQAEIGRPMTAADAAEQVAGAGLLGGGIGLGGKLLERLLGRLAGHEGRQAADVPPSVRAAATAVEDGVHRAQDTPFADSDQGRDRHRAALLATTRALDERNPAKLPAEGLAPIQRGTDVSLEAAQRQAGFQIQSRDPRTVGTDADAMQYKGGADAKGVTDRLAGVEDWDPAKAGLSLWYERADGKVVVADGHQRLGLAQRVSDTNGEAVPYFGVTYREADGVTAQQMRAIAALKNIAEGSGSSVDAARVLRDAPDGVKQLPPRSPLVRQARDLLALGDDAWGMTVNGQASERDAALVGRHVKDPAMQTAILGHLAKDSPDTATEAELFVRQALAAGAASHVQDDMFGSFLKADLILPQRVKILTGALSQLRRDKALFATLTDKADAIEGAGNKLNAAENAARQETAARAFATVAALAERKGPISDALQAAAEAAARTGDRRTATAGFLKDVRGRLERGELDGEQPGGTVGDVEPATAPEAVPARDTADRELALFSDPVGKPEAFAQQTADLAREIAIVPATKRYSLIEIPEPVDISKGGKGEPFVFTIHNSESGTEVGSVYGNYSALDKHLHIESIRAGGGFGERGALGPAATRQLLTQLQDKFPEARTVGGERISGARGDVDPLRAVGPEVKVNLPGKGDGIPLENGFGPAQEQIDALLSLPQDAEFPGGSLFGKGEDTSITVKEAREQIEREARAVERLRGCAERGTDAV